jgi:excisionase family DNA binding protein
MSVMSTEMGGEQPAVRLTYDLTELAALLGIGRNQCYSAAKTGQIAGLRIIKIGRRMVVSKSAVDKLLNGAA